MCSIVENSYNHEHFCLFICIGYVYMFYVVQVIKADIAVNISVFSYKLYAIATNGASKNVHVTLS